MLSAKNIDKTFMQGTKAVQAIRNVNLRVERGERVYIHGPSGGGKSTLLHVLGGLSTPSEGSVSFRDEDIYARGGNRRSRLRYSFFGLVFQFYYLLPELDVIEIVMLPAITKGAEPVRRIKARAADLLGTVNMTGRLGHKTIQLSEEGKSAV